MPKKFKYDSVSIFTPPLFLRGFTVYGTLFNKKHEEDIIEGYILNHLKSGHDHINGKLDNFSFQIKTYDHPIKTKEGDVWDDWIIQEDFIKNLPSS